MSDIENEAPNNYEELESIASELNRMIRESEVFNDYSALKIVIEEDELLADKYQQVMKAGEELHGSDDKVVDKEVELPDIPDQVTRFVDAQKKLAHLLNSVVTTVSESIRV